MQPNEWLKGDPAQWVKGEECRRNDSRDARAPDVMGERVVDQSTPSGDAIGLSENGNGEWSRNKKWPKGNFIVWPPAP